MPQTSATIAKPLELARDGILFLAMPRRVNGPDISSPYAERTLPLPLFAPITRISRYLIRGQRTAGGPLRIPWLR